MKLEHSIPIEVKGCSFTLSDVSIGNKAYKCTIRNREQSMYITFSEGDREVYEIKIATSGVEIGRLVSRPKHDHDSMEYLTHDGWSSNWRQAYKIPFGKGVS